MESLRKLGMYAVPVVARGERRVLGRDLAEIDRLFGWQPNAHKPLPGKDLAERMQRLLEAAVRYARQLPAEHYGDVIPGQEHVTGPLVLADGSVLRRNDGTPYIPHHTYFDLVAHIAGHAEKFIHLAEHPASEVFARIDTFAPLGEPDADATLDNVCGQLATASAAIGGWSRSLSERDLAVSVRTFDGVSTLHAMLDSMTYSTAQHTRQLLAILEMLGIEPDGPLTDADCAGLALPVATWS